jgi:predicted transcriptional regulator
MSEGIPDSIKQFLARYIRSVEHIEILLLLRNQPDRTWTVLQVYEVIRSSQSSIEKGLERFAAHGFLAEEKESQATYRYAPRTEELSAALEQIEANYRVSRVRMIEAIFAAEVDPAQEFADAFKLRKN